MRILLDTHVLLWWLDDDPRLSKTFREAIRNPANEVWVSAISFAEIAVKQAIDKLDAPYISDELVAEQGMCNLSFGANHGRKVRELPLHHRDPFDRMLIAQAIEEDLVLATVDETFSRYDVRRL
ncbi:MAG TPA: type II toxin-antitoxin system VapC family toxin [Pseudolysinimonas sp.]